MKFTEINEEDRRKFLNSEKYYKSKDNFCLGKNLEEAGEIAAMIIADNLKPQKSVNNEKA